MNPIPLSLSLVAIVIAHAAAEIATCDLTLRDDSRGKDVECRVHFPTTGDKLPLIVFAHGFGADRTAFTPIAEDWAAHGYLVIHPSHWDGFGKSKGQGAPLPADGLPALMKNAALKIEDRVGDIRAPLETSPYQAALSLDAKSGKGEP